MSKWALTVIGQSVEQDFSSELQSFVNSLSTVDQSLIKVRFLTDEGETELPVPVLESSSSPPVPAATPDPTVAPTEGEQTDG